MSEVDACSRHFMCVQGNLLDILDESARLQYGTPVPNSPYGLCGKLNFEQRGVTE